MRDEGRRWSSLCKTPGGLSHGVKSGERGVGCGDSPRLPSFTQSSWEMRNMNPNPTFESDLQHQFEEVDAAQQWVGHVKYPRAAFALHT